MSRIDYSKWDHIEDSSSSDDDARRMQRPRVTRLDAPSTITTGGTDGSITVVQPQQPQAVLTSKKKKKANDVDATSANDKNNSKERSSSSSSLVAAAAETATIPASWTDKGAAAVVAAGVTTTTTTKYYWSQDRTSVQVRVPILPDNDGKKTKTNKYTCQVTNILPYTERQNAVMGGGQQQQTLIIVQSNTTNGDSSKKKTLLLLEGDLSHPVHLAEDDDEIDWSIETHHAATTTVIKYILITLYKATPLAGMTIWWKHLLTTEPEIDLTTWRVDGDNSSAFQQAWDQAHEQFRKNIQTKQQHSV